MSRANLQGAILVDANIQGANARGAEMQGAELTGARLEGADLSSADLRGAHLRNANLRGARLSGASLQGADLFGVDLQGANFSDFTVANENTGAIVHRSTTLLENVNFFRARLKGAQLNGARLWMARHPNSPGSLELVDLSREQLEPMTNKVRFETRALVEKRIGNEIVRKHVLGRLEPILGDPSQKWSDKLQWQADAAKQNADPATLAAFLFNLACENSYIARQTAWRALEASKSRYGLLLVRKFVVADLKKCPGIRGITADQMSHLKTWNAQFPPL